MTMQSTPGRIDIDGLRRALHERIHDVLAVILPVGMQRGDEYWALNRLRADKHLGSFSFRTGGDRIGVWNDFADDTSGDLFHYVQALGGMSFLDAARYLAGLIGFPVDAPAPACDFPPIDPNQAAEWKKRAADGTLNGRGCRLIDLAESKRVPIDYLREIGLREHEGWPARGEHMAMPCHVEIPYRDQSGRQFGLRRRSDIVAKQGSSWKSSSQLIPYGLDRIAGSEPLFLLVEGESDCWVLWHNGIPSIGIPGASTWKDEWAALLPDNVPLYLVKEPDAAGGALTKKIAASPIASRVRVVELTGNVKDPAQLWIDLGADHGAFHLAITEACTRAKPLVEKPLVQATPFRWRDPAEIPKRQWLYGTHLIRGFLSLIAAPGGAGKTALSILDAVALATGHDLAGRRVHERCRVWLWNLEDPIDEMQRRIAAAVVHLGVDPNDLDGWLFTDSGRDQGLCTATGSRDGAVINRPVVDALTAELVNRRIDVLMVDPFVSSHQVPENDNGSQDAVAKEWGRVAHRANCAIRLAHHMRKLGNAEATSESLRGGKALVDAARSTLVLNRMLPEEAEKAGLDTHLRHFRAYDDKNNLAPAADKSDWYRFVSVDLANGDQVGVVEPWRWPDPFADVSASDLEAVCAELRRKDYRESSQSADWAGVAVAEVLRLDLSDGGAKHQVRRLLDTWLSSEALEIVESRDAQRKLRKYLKPKDKR